MLGVGVIEDGDAVAIGDFDDLADEGVGQSRGTDDNKDTEREYRDCSAHVFIPWVGNLAYQRRLPEQWELARGGE